MFQVNMFIRLCSILLILASLNSFGQKTKAQLKKERKELNKKIEEANTILQQTQNQQKASIGELNALANLIKINEEYAGNLNEEIILARADIKTVQTEIDTLDIQIEKLVKAYEESLYKAQKTINDREQLIFLFSSENYNQLSLRIKYLEMVREARRKQLEKIKRVKIERANIQKKLSKKNIEKQKALDKANYEKQRLDSLKSNQANVIEQLNSQRGELLEDIEDYKKEQDKIDKLINDIIKAEIERKKRLEKERLEAEHRKLALNSKNFEANKGKLTWPIKKGFVSRKFGLQEHPTIPGIKVNNPGVGLQTAKNAEVRAVYSGTVMTVAEIPGAGKLVMVSHGNYFTVYSKLKSTTVKKGDGISYGQVIGIVNTDPKGVTELGFQIWKDTEKQNPELWLSKN